MKIAVLAGGLSPERDVSLVSASLIASALCRRGHRVAFIDVYLGTDETDPEKLFTNIPPVIPKVSETEPDLEELKRKSGNGDALIGKNVINVCLSADRVFVGLHGGMGENGQLQACLDCFGIKYTGTGYAGSLLAMDKELTKAMFSLAGVTTPEGIMVRNDGNATGEIASKIGFPCVVKPCSCGSSVGVSIVDTEAELAEALSKAFFYEDRVLVEKKIVGRELTVGILRGKVLPPIEIIPKCGFYDYKNKYQKGLTEEICPAPITSAELETVDRTALKAMHALKIDESSYCRADFILAENGEAYCLEVNTLPGMTPTSLIPQAAAAAGIGYDELCEIIAGI